MPRVLTMVICDEVLSSEIESEVHTLANARIGVVVDRFPHLRRMDLYLVLSHYHPRLRQSPRKENYNTRSHHVQIKACARHRRYR